MSDQDSSTSQQKIEALNSEVFDIKNIPTSKEAAEENKAKGLDTTNLKQWALQQHTQATAKVKLEKVKQQRLAQETQIKGMASQPVPGIEDLKSWLLDRLHSLAPNERAQVYCRDFETATEEDLIQMREDILALEKLSDQDSQNEF